MSKNISTAANHRRVEQFIRDRIRSGALKPGDPILPSAGWRSSSLSRLTIRLALLASFTTA